MGIRPPPYPGTSYAEHVEGSLREEFDRQYRGDNARRPMILTGALRQSGPTFLTPRPFMCPPARRWRVDEQVLFGFAGLLLFLLGQALGWWPW